MVRKRRAKGQLEADGMGIRVERGKCVVMMTRSCPLAQPPFANSPLPHRQASQPPDRGLPPLPSESVRRYFVRPRSVPCCRDSIPINFSLPHLPICREKACSSPLTPDFVIQKHTGHAARRPLRFWSMDCSVTTLLSRFHPECNWMQQMTCLVVAH